MRKRNRGFSFIELLVVLMILGVILAIAIPRFTSIRMNAAETAVIRQVQSIHQAQIQYSSQFGEYASSLTQLGPTAAKLIPGSLASGEKNGYVFTLAKTPVGFTLNANPRVFGKTGSRCFYIDEDGIVRENNTPEPATISSPELK